MKTSNSGRRDLDEIDLKQLGKHSVGVLGPAIVILLGDFFNMIDWGVWTPIAAAGLTMLLDFLRKWVRDNSNSGPKVLK